MEIINTRPAGIEHQVVTIAGDHKGSRQTPCSGCPWRVDTTGEFPAEAFEHSAETSYDMSTHVFACHESGVKGGHVCAGFLLRGADHNLTVRLGRRMGRYMPPPSDGGHQLHDSYRAMAIANGVAPDKPCLTACRP